MQDGNTATISPVPSEDEMNKLRQWFDNGLNAIVQATELAKVVESLKVEVEGMRHEIATVRDNNRWLDEQLSGVRKARDEAIETVAQLRTELSRTLQERAQLQSMVDEDGRTIQALRDKTTTILKERDDALLEAMQAREDLDKANAKLASIKASLGLVEAPSQVASGQGTTIPHGLLAPHMVEVDLSVPRSEAVHYNPDPPKPYWER